MEVSTQGVAGAILTTGAIRKTLKIKGKKNTGSRELLVRPKNPGNFMILLVQRHQEGISQVPLTGCFLVVV